MGDNLSFIVPTVLQYTGIRVAIERAHPAKRLPRRLLEYAAVEVLRIEGITTSSLTLVLCDDAMIHSINVQFLQHDWATDVISFCLSDNPLEGEIYISIDTARQQAAEYGVTLSNELVRLTVHGVLHVLGYDDCTEQDRLRMHAVQERYVAHIMELWKQRRNPRRLAP